jgi:RNA polymerase sigma factor (sigma-70 family)
MNITNDPVVIASDIISDDEVIARVLDGETNLYAVLVRRYNQRLYRVAMSIINNDSEAEELIQVAYIKAFENLGKFKHKASFSTWVIRILINECLQTKKRQKALTMNDDINESEIHSQFATVQTPLTTVLNTELKNILEEAISRLPEKYKTVFVLRELENMSVAETQECLDLSETNVKVRLNRARAMLKNYLSSLYKKEDLLHLHLSRCDRITQNVMNEIPQPKKFNIQAN